MCDTCGCSEGSRTTITDMQIDPHAHAAHEHGHGHEHGHDHGHARASADSHSKTIRLDQEILGKNRMLAERNRGWFDGRGIVALNLMSSPGSGKTTLLVRTIREIGSELNIHVVEGDQATTRDAERIRAAGCRVIQVNTGAGCHLDAEMLDKAIRQLNPPLDSTLMIENVGNLICPALFDLGERAKVVIASVTEGEDKPLKYPHMFQSADLVILNKIDLLPHLNFNVGEFLESLKMVNATVSTIQLSATAGTGLEEWYNWLRTVVKEK